MSQERIPYRINHIDGRIIRVELWASIVRDLSSTNLVVREKARRAVCVIFKEVSNAKASPFKLGFVNWEDLRLYSLKTAPEMPNGMLNPQWRLDPQGDSCDECNTCELGQHEICESEYCVVAYA